MSDSDNPLFSNRSDGAFGGRSLNEVIQNPVLARDYGFEEIRLDQYRFDENPFDQYRCDDVEFMDIGNGSQDTNINALWYIVGAEAIFVALIFYFSHIAIF